MHFDDPLFSGFSPAKKRIAIAYEYIRFQVNSGGDTITRRVAKELGYTLDENKSSSYIRRVIREYQMKKQEEERKKGN